MRIIAAVAITVLTVGSAALAHDIPNDVTVRAFLHPEGHRLRFLVRVPLRAMRDVDIPTRGPGYLDLTRAEGALRHAATIWIAQNTELFEEGAPLGAPRLAGVRVSLPSDPSFADYDRALAHVTGPPLDPATDLYWEQGVLDAVLDYPITSASSRFSIRAEVRRLGLRVAYGLRLVTADGTVRAFEFHDDSGLVRLDPRWHQAALSFAGDGFRHVLDGIDHLLFLLCVVIPLRRLRPLVSIVTSFTVAHSITLIASAYGLAPDALWFPPLVETLIAVSIVYMALENVVVAMSARNGQPSRAVALVDRRWIVAGLFGLVHGFGYSFALRERLQFAGGHLLASLLSFNAGVELAQLVTIAVAAACLGALWRWVVDERLGAIILSATVAHTAWHWTTERADVLRQFPWPSVEAPALASLIVWAMVAVALAAAVWAARLLSSSRGWSRDALGQLGPANGVGEET